MTLGTIAVVVVLATIVAAIIYREAKARKAGINPRCSECGACKSCGMGDTGCSSSSLKKELLQEHHNANS